MPKDICKIKCPRFEKDPSDDLPVKGAKIVGKQLYFNSIILGKTNSGKTIMLNHLVRNSIDKDTVVFVFSGSVNQDKVWKDLTSWFKKKNIKHVLFEDIIENGVNQLEAVISEINQTLQECDDMEEKQPIEPQSLKPSLILCNTVIKNEKEDAIEKTRKPRKKKYRTPRFLFLIDDQTKASLRNTDSLANFLKSSRHRLSRVYILTQATTDIDPKAYAQASQLVIFNGFSKPWIHGLWQKLSTHLTFNEFWDLYQTTTAQKYSFLNIQLRDNTYRQNFGKINPL